MMVDLAKMYELINNKNKNTKSFLEFLYYMFEIEPYINSTGSSSDIANFRYHFRNIPNDTKNMLVNLRYDLIGDVANISMMTNRLSKKIDVFTTIKED